MEKHAAQRHQVKSALKSFLVMFKVLIIKAVTVIFYTIAKVINQLYTSNFYSI